MTPKIPLNYIHLKLRFFIYNRFYEATGRIRQNVVRNVETNVDFSFLLRRLLNCFKFAKINS